MPSYPLQKLDCFITKPRPNHVIITLLDEPRFKSWIKDQPKDVKNAVDRAGFKGQSGKIVDLGSQLLVGLGSECGIYDSAAIVPFIQKLYSDDALKKTSLN